VLYFFFTLLDPKSLYIIFDKTKRGEITTIMVNKTTTTTVATESPSWSMAALREQEGEDGIDIKCASMKRTMIS
jgi:hypothetical protein